jgi:hypothetical protein
LKNYVGGGDFVGDAFVAKYSPEGTLLWTKQLVNPDPDESEPVIWALDVATDTRENVFISGFTNVSLAGENKRFYDAWVAKYDSKGKLLWKKQRGTSEFDVSLGVATDSQGNVFISGDSSPVKDSDVGYYAWVGRYSSDGKLTWWRREGSRPGLESATDVATDSNGHVLVTGVTTGNLGD